MQLHWFQPIAHVLASCYWRVLCFWPQYNFHALVFYLEDKRLCTCLYCYHCVYNFRNARLTYLLILNCIMHELMFDMLSRMSFLSCCSLALFTSRRTLGACPRRVMLRGYVFSGSCKQDSISLPSICTGVPMWNRSFTDQWTEQTTAAGLALARITSCNLCHLQGLVRALIHAWTTQSIWSGQLSSGWNFLLEFYRVQENSAADTDPMPFSDHYLNSVI